jgi:hypothetical protein
MKVVRPALPCTLPAAAVAAAGRRQQQKAVREKEDNGDHKRGKIVYSVRIV